MILLRGYVPLSDFDYTFLPRDFGEDVLIPYDGYSKCSYCGDDADFYNETVSTHVCVECTIKGES